MTLHGNCKNYFRLEDPSFVINSLKILEESIVNLHSFIVENDLEHAIFDYEVKLRVLMDLVITLEKRVIQEISGSNFKIYNTLLTEVNELNEDFKASELYTDYTNHLSYLSQRCKQNEIFKETMLEIKRYKADQIARMSSKLPNPKVEFKLLQKKVTKESNENEKNYDDHSECYSTLNMDDFQESKKPKFVLKKQLSTINIFDKRKSYDVNDMNFDEQNLRYYDFESSVDESSQSVDCEEEKLNKESEKHKLPIQIDESKVTADQEK